MAKVARQPIEAWQKRLAKLQAAGNADAVVAAARKMAETQPGNRAVQHALCALYLRSRGEESGPGLRECLQSVLGWRVALEAGNELVAEGREEEALEILVAVADRNLPHTLRLERAVRLRLAGRLEEAESDLTTAVELNPYHAAAWDELIALYESEGRLDDANRARARRDAVPAKLSAAEVVERINGAFPGESGRYVVNLGCRDGKLADDPCYELFEKGHPGLAVDAESYPELHRNLPQPEVRKLLDTMLTPANVVDVLRREGCPQQPALLKIDIDSFDGPLLGAILADFAPDAIHIEVNADFPPPLRFAIQYDHRYRHGGGAGFFGCSLAYLTALCRPFGYELLQVDMSNPPTQQDAILVKEQYLSLFGVKRPVDERALFLAEPVSWGRGLVTIGVDAVSWRSRTDFDALLSEVWDACVLASTIRAKRVLPFVLTI